MEHVLYARHLTEIISIVLRYRHWGHLHSTAEETSSGSSSNVPELTQLMESRAGIHTQVHLTWGPERLSTCPHAPPRGVLTQPGESQLLPDRLPWTCPHLPPPHCPSAFPPPALCSLEQRSLPSPCLLGPRGHVVWRPNSRFTPCTAAEGPEAEAGGCRPCAAPGAVHVLTGRCLKPSLVPGHARHAPCSQPLCPTVLAPCPHTPVADLFLTRGMPAPAPHSS